MNEFEDCNDCRNYAYDEEDEAGCSASFDEDDLAKMQEAGKRAHCPFWCRESVRTALTGAGVTLPKNRQKTASTLP